MIPRLLAAAGAAALIMLFTTFPLHGAEPDTFEDLPSLVAAALANNPELKASTDRWRMFTSRVDQARSLDDPMLMLKIQNGLVTDPLNFGKEPMTSKVIGISQQIPFWGKREIRGEVAAREADSYRWSLEERKLELARMVRENYYRIWAIDKTTAIVDKNIRILDDFITLAETRYSVGQGAQQDVFKAQVERSRQLDTRISLVQQRRSAEAALNALLSRPADTPFGKVPDFDIKPLALDGRSLRETAYGRRPLVKSLQAEIDKGAAGRRLAGRESYPDFNLAFEYMQRNPVMGGEGDDMYSLGLTFNLPVQRGRRHAMAAEADSAARMASEELANLKNVIDSGISDLVARLDRSRRQAELYRNGIIPQAAQSLESATIGYRVGKVDFLTLLDSRLTLFNYERDYYEALAEYQMKLAQLEALIGGDL